MGYIGVSYNPLTNHLLTSWDIQVGPKDSRDTARPSHKYLQFRCHQLEIRW